MPIDLCFLGGDPLRPFAAAPGATSDAALTEVFGWSTLIDAVPEPTSTVTLPASKRGELRSDARRPAASGDVVPHRVGSGIHYVRSSGHAAAGNVVGPSDSQTVAARPSSGEPRLVSRGHHALHDGSASTRPLADWLTESASTWTGLAARGATTPVRIPATSGIPAWTRPNLAATATSARTPSGATSMPAGETLSATNPPSAAPAERTVSSPALPLRSSSLLETRAHLDPPARLAGLARWWNETHAPDSTSGPDTHAGLDAGHARMGDVRKPAPIRAFLPVPLGQRCPGHCPAQRAHVRRWPVGFTALGCGRETLWKLGT